ncbi:GTPase/DUF3482 domain-containing protein [Zwartia sp.]|uniref:GTPase/DUF3482 domain-containing protein n=1 Tax=Zwartia sp. TaxID=2978004 RepID=UPI003BAEA662
MTEQPTLQIAVVGHTNVGKTSLLRTLIRDVNFGEVEDMPGTTRQVQGAHIMLGTQTALLLFDTPGIEDSIGLLDYLEQLSSHSQRLDGPDRIRLFLESPEASALYEQEARVLHKLLSCHAGLYVVDVREPVLAKHRDELAILSSCARPLLPILNFVASDTARTQEWRDALARVGLHSSLAFDSMSPPLDGEEKLYQALSLLLSPYEHILLELQEQSSRQREARHASSINLIASMLLDVAALRMRTSIETDTLAKKIALQQSRVREREQACVNALLSLFQFRRDDYLSSPLPLNEGRWELDLFSPQALQHFGVHVSMGIAAGAAAGATVDVLSAGLSLGTGMAIGAIAGGAWKAIDRWGDRVLGKMRGFRELTVDQSILQMLALRQIQLLNRLEHRGHAALTPLRLEQAPHLSLDNPTLTKIMTLARAHPDWSSIGDDFNDSPARQRAIESLARGLS